MVKNSYTWGSCELRKNVSSHGSPPLILADCCCFLGNIMSTTQKTIGWSTCCPVSNVSHASPWEAVLDSSSRGVGEWLPWLSITCCPQGWGSALLQVCGQDTSALAAQRGLPLHSCCRSLIPCIPRGCYKCTGSFSKSHHRNDSHSALVLVGWGSVFLLIKSKSYQLAHKLQFPGIHELWSPGKGNEAQGRWKRVSLCCFMVFQSGGAPTHTKIN